MKRISSTTLLFQMTLHLVQLLMIKCIHELFILILSSHARVKTKKTNKKNKNNKKKNHVTKGVSRRCWIARWLPTKIDVWTPVP